MDNTKKNCHAADHMANERTFLAWVRTSIGIMAFGFVIEKFTLFTREMTLVLGKSNPLLLPNVANTLQRYSSIFGVLLVLLGVLLCLLAYIKYKKNAKLIDDDTYKPPRLLMALTTLAVVIIGIFLIIYLI